MHQGPSSSLSLTDPNTNVSRAMAPSGENTTTNYSSQSLISRKAIKPSKLSMEGIQRTLSDISSDPGKERPTGATDGSIPPPAVPEIEDAKCECCGMSEECTPEYIRRVRDRFSGRLICGLCSEAVMEEMGRTNSGREEALHAHMSACARFNRIGRTHPLLYQADAVREILKKSSGIRGKSLSPRDGGGRSTADRSSHYQTKSSKSRSSSCMAAITKEIGDRTIVN